MSSIFPGQSPAFDAYVDPARPRAELWRTLLGLVLIVIGWIAMAAGLVMMARLGSRLLGTDDLVARMMTDADGPGVTAAFLASFLALTLSLMLVMRVLFRRSLLTLIAPSRRVNWGLYLKGVFFVAVFGLLTTGLASLADPPNQQMAFGRWLLWAPLGLLLLMLQTGTEELLFRGYFMQQLGARFRSPWLWWVLPSLLFGLLHWNPGTFGANAPLVVLAASVLGLILGDVTARTGSLSLAMGLHLANNLSAVLIVGMPSQISGMALFLADVDMSDTAAVRTGLLINLATILVAYGIYLMVMARRRT
ncbi:CPBP family intramembrane glutamic endopeptidase [Oceanomicrobium pacificus]|uniref:CPBP family intramembrane metalloprotease n=1 Tax=Oceanomicrobium pacificus TaxID=2692916 RepID=A0A6B0TJT3_9RHOB|nr:type II CAAX endopeptidase family protein [Oceanomicrobium pacificus]MXU64750.1 CPBP family intramembrane metalloprotease [Oceanomicrobium pacificus]